MKARTAPEKRHMARVAALGCIVCRNLGEPGTPAECHHINNGTLGKRSGNRLVLPLCPFHHRQGPPGSAVHASRSMFEANHGTELELLDQTLELLEE